MRAGDLSGLGSLYDENGNILLLMDEEVLRKIPNDNVMAIRGKGRLRGKTLLDITKEKGTMYLTNKRLVYLRHPDPWLKIRTYGTALGMGTAVSEAAKARDLKRLGGMQYLEVYYSEVKSFKSKKGKWAELYLDDEDGVPIRVLLDRRGRQDDKILLLEELLTRAGAEKLS